jgi:hypothetical protein
MIDSGCAPCRGARPSVCCDPFRVKSKILSDPGVSARCARSTPGYYLAALRAALLLPYLSDYLLRQVCHRPNLKIGRICRQQLWTGAQASSLAFPQRRQPRRLRSSQCQFQIRSLPDFLGKVSRGQHHLCERRVADALSRPGWVTPSRTFSRHVKLSLRQCFRREVALFADLRRLISDLSLL